MPKKPQSSKAYTVTLSFKSGEIVKGTGDTALEAMQAIKLPDPKEIGLLSVDFNGKHVEKMVNASKLKRMFGIKASPFIRKTALNTYTKFLISGLC